MKIDIRSAEIADIGALSRVVNKTWKKDYAGLIPEKDIERMTAYGRREDSYKKLFSDGADIFCVEVDKEVRGVCTVTKAEENWLPDYCVIMQLYIDPDFQRIGLGRKLLSYTLRAMRGKGFRRAYLWELVGNKKAEAFYSKFGFTDDGKRIEPDGFSERIETKRYSIEL